MMNRPRMPPSLERKIKKLYLQGIPLSRIVHTINYCEKTIYNVLKRNGMQPNRPRGGSERKYSVDDSYFDVINTNDKAYLLGLWYADGYNNEARGNIEIGFAEKDKDLLDIVRKLLKTNVPIRVRKGKKKTHQPFHHICVTSRQLSDSLTSMGCMQNKSLKLHFPNKKQLPRRFIPDFIRGYFDGDGSVYLRKDGCIHASIIGTWLFCENVRMHLQNQNIRSYLYQSTNSPQYQLNISMKDIITFATLLYRDSHHYGNRKYQVFCLSTNQVY